MNKTLKGVLIVLSCTVFWAITGNAGAFLFETNRMTPAQVTSIRELFAGGVLVVYHAFKTKKKTLYLYKTKADLLRVIAFGLFGILFMQLFFYMAIEESNAPTASIIQYTAPFMVMAYFAIKTRKMPTPLMMTALFMALGGVFLLITHGDITTLAITEKALFFGLCAAVGYALYNIIPIDLLARYDSVQISGLGMLTAGVFLTILTRPFQQPYVLDLPSILAAGYVAIFGTLIPFVIYLEGAKLIGAPKASIIATAEPLLSTVIAVLFLNQTFYPIDYAGVILVIIAVMLLSVPDRKKLVQSD